MACYKICNVRVNAPRLQASEPAEQQPASLANSSNASKKGLLSPHVEEVTKAMDLEPNAHEKVICSFPCALLSERGPHAGQCLGAGNLVLVF